MEGENISGPDYDICGMLTIHSLDRPDIPHGYGIDVRAYPGKKRPVAVYTIDIYGRMQGIDSFV